MRSWDCFDTIIGRKHFYPKSIFYIVSNKINDLSFVQKRIVAEKNSKLKTYEDIYRLLPEYDPQIELDTELEYTFPINCNFQQINDGDIVVSDMYLSASQIEKILRHHGLDKDITVYSSPGGKKNGSMWERLKTKHKIEVHTGDNIQSDILNARRNDISSIYFPGKTFTSYETKVMKECANLAYLMRALRLSSTYQSHLNAFTHKTGSFCELAPDEWVEEKNGNIYRWKYYKILPQNTGIQLLKQNQKKNFIIHISYSGSISKNNKEIIRNGKWFNYNILNQKVEQKLWYEQTQLNIPALILIAQLLPKNKNLTFTERDCWYLKLIYDKIHNTNSSCLHVSRGSYKNPYNNEYISYVLETAKDSVVVDLHGSCLSPSTFFIQHTDDIKQEFIYVCFHVKNQVVHQVLDIKQLLSCNQTNNCMGRSLEKFNIHNIGALINWDNKPIRYNISENHISDSVAQELAIKKCLEYLPSYNISTISNTELLSLLIASMKNSYTDKNIALV